MNVEYIYIYIYVCMYVCICIHLYIYIYIHIYRCIVCVDVHVYVLPSMALLMNPKAQRSNAFTEILTDGTMDESKGSTQSVREGWGEKGDKRKRCG